MKKIEYFMKTEQYDVDYFDYYDVDRTFGHFEDAGRSYKVTDRHTPRQWFSVMCNDKFASIRTNDGKGFISYKAFYLRLTKFYSETDYMVRHINGARKIILENIDDSKKYDIFNDCENLEFTVRPGSCEYTGSIEDISFKILVFVPNDDAAECMKLEVSSAKGGKIKLSLSEDWAFLNVQNNTKEFKPVAEPSVTLQKDYALLYTDKIYQFKNLYGFFGMKGCISKCDPYTETLSNGDVYTFHTITLEKEIEIGKNETIAEYVIAGACEEEPSAYLNKYFLADTFQAEFHKVEQKWSGIIEKNYCELPDKNLQYFLNIWLKNQLDVTSKYNRFDLMGYRDILQDCWGALYVDSKITRNHMLIAASKMYADGRCPRQFDLYSDILDRRDFSDSPVWLPIALSSYLKETSDFAVLDEPVAYLESDEVTTLLEHVWRSLEYLYHSRGKNGLILMRGGDWLDGLGGINKLGEATSVWLTMASFYVQNLMAEIYDKLGGEKQSQILRERSAEYKEIVNRVAWNGKWFSYATINDTEILGTHAVKEGKIFLNPNTWAIFTGIADADKIDKIVRAINLYLVTPYGPQLLAPPYVCTGENYGRLRKQRPGTFANAASYLHAASFKVYADIARGEPEEAVDTFMRLLPNHCDNPDSRRTSEPYAVGNVHYGSNHPCYGLNLYSWFTATPAWLIHGGFEEILGVKAEFDGLSLTPLKLEGWDEYKVSKEYRNSKYNIVFKKTGKNQITVNGKTVTGNIVKSEDPEVNVLVEF